MYYKNVQSLININKCKCAIRCMYSYTDDVVDLTDLSMHFTVHSEAKCLGVYAKGYGTCTFQGCRLPFLLSLYSVLHSCGVNALLVSHMYKVKSQ